MRFNYIILIFTLLGFLMLGGSGLVLFFAFEEDVFKKVLSWNQSDWVDVHMVLAVIQVLLVAYHVGKRWNWIEKYLIEFKTKTISAKIRRKQVSNAAMLISFSLSLLSGFLGWILSGECDVCLLVHQYAGLLLWVVFLYHVFLHQKSFFR